MMSHEEQKSLMDQLERASFPMTRTELLAHFGDYTVTWIDGAHQRFAVLLACIEQHEFKSASDVMLAINTLAKTH